MNPPPLIPNSLLKLSSSDLRLCISNYPKHNVLEIQSSVLYFNPLKFKAGIELETSDCCSLVRDIRVLGGNSSAARNETIPGPLILGAIWVKRKLELLPLRDQDALNHVLHNLEYDMMLREVFV